MRVTFTSGRVRYSLVSIPEGRRDRDRLAENITADPTLWRKRKGRTSKPSVSADPDRPTKVQGDRAHQYKKPDPREFEENNEFS